MNVRKVSPVFISGILVTLFLGIALFLRVYLPYDKVFTADWIKFSGGDAYSHMRLVDNLVRNFPHLMTFDPYQIYPSGAGVVGMNFFDWLLAILIWVIGLGSPTEHTVDVVGVYFPTVLGALTVIPVYFIGKELFNRWAGVISAGLVALLPGEFLGRSILGFTDHHVAETLFTTVIILFLILAIKTASQRQLTFSHLKRRGWATSAKPVLYSLLAGIFLGIYLHTWAGGLLFVFIISLYFVVQFTIDHLKGKPTDYLCVVGVTLFFIAAIMFLPVYHEMFYALPMVVALVIPLVLSGISRLMAGKKIKRVYYTLSLAGLGLAGLGLFYLISPFFLKSMLGVFRVFVPTGVELTTIEMWPSFMPLVSGGNLFDTAAWGNFNTTLFFSLISFFCILIHFVIKQGSAEKSLLAVWSLVILAATIGQRRFAYYFVVNVALLTGYLSVLLYYGVRFIIDRLSGVRTDYLAWRMLELPSFEEVKAQPVRALARVQRKRAKRLERKKTKRLEREKARMAKRPEPRFRVTIIHTSISLWIVFILFFLAFFPSPKVVANAEQAGLTGGVAWWHSCVIGMAIDTASRVQYVPSDAWCSSLSWMRENTPDPFGNPDFYYHLETSHKYRSLSELKSSFPNTSGDPDFYYQLEESYKYPESAYGVMAWWDYGYWITRIAHRIPNANPGQDPRAVKIVASFFTSQNESSANEIAQELGTAYVIVDFEIATGKFWAVALWAGKEQTDFFNVYLVPQPEKNRFVGRLFYYPEYYRSLSTRLYNFDGLAVTPESTLVISYQEMADKEGNIYKVVTNQEPFDSYEEAEAYLSSQQESANYRIVSDNPFISSVPLEALEHYRLIHSSDSSVTMPDGKQVPEVKIFECIY